MWFSLYYYDIVGEDKIIIKMRKLDVHLYGGTKQVLTIYPFGSYPLKTYLPDGDIDLTIISFRSSEETLALDVRTILEREEMNTNSQYEVKNVRFINAEVKLVKCMVQKFLVDISFNQIGGLSTLCFIEQVDRFIGKDHLFKRSIILIKAWCCYESHILGAQHGLISTYALETLVLYILHRFHSPLDGPLAVLYRFLDYYSKFNWDKYCISLKGPIALTSLPELSVEPIDSDGGELLLTEEFLRSCVDSFSIPMKYSEVNPRPFIRKFLNIVDPLRENNNLGRSVNQGTFSRIRSAFGYGAQILGRLLMLPAGSIRHEVNVFFKNTLDRHGVGERPDVKDLAHRLPRSALVESSEAELVQPIEKLEIKRTDEISSESLTSKAYSDMNKELKSIRISGLDESEVIVSRKQTLSHKHQNSTNGDVSCISSERLVSDAAKVLATSSMSAVTSMTESPTTSSSTKEDSILDFRKASHPPHQFFNPENQTIKDLTLAQINSGSLDPSFNVPSASALSSDEGIIISKQPDFCENDSSLSNTDLIINFADGYASDPLNSAYHGMKGNKGNRSIQSPLLDKILDLSGDYHNHLNVLNFAVWYQEKAKSGNFVAIYQSTPYSYYSHGEDVWTHDGLFTGPSPPGPPLSPTSYYSIVLPFVSSSNNTGNVPRARGTGTYFPNVTYQAFRNVFFPRRVNYAMSEDNPPMFQSNLQAAQDIPQGMSSMEKWSHELASYSENASGMLPARHASKVPPKASKMASPPQFGTIKFGTFGPVSLETPTKEHVRESPISYSRGSGFTSPASISRRPTETLTSNKGTSNEESSLQSFEMNDEDFPPLSGSGFTSPASIPRRPTDISSTSNKKTSNEESLLQPYEMNDEVFPPLSGSGFISPASVSRRPTETSHKKTSNEERSLQPYEMNDEVFPLLSGSGFTSPGSVSRRPTETLTSNKKTSNEESSLQPYEMNDEDFPPLPSSGFKRPALFSRRPIETLTSIMETSNKESSPQSYEMKEEDFPPLSG